LLSFRCADKHDPRGTGNGARRSPLHQLIELAERVVADGPIQLHVMRASLTK
jgi:hypothetical protein